MKKVLTIAGSDCSGGAGIQADLKTFSAYGVFGMSVIAAVTAQNTQKVIDVQDIAPDIIGKQIDAIYEDIEVDAVKIGMLSRCEGVKIVASKAKEYGMKNMVVDPVMVSKSGYFLMKPDTIDTLLKELVPLSTVITPNIPEAEVISSMKIKTLEDMEKSAKVIYEMGPKNVLVKGGHLTSDATDVLYDGKEFTYYKSQRINTKNTHGTGCTISSAIASNLALGMNIKEAVESAKKYITQAIIHSLDIGQGSGPTNHFYELYKKAGLNYE